MTLRAWIDPEGEVFPLGSVPVHADWSRAAGTTRQKMMEGGWIQIDGDSIRSFTPVRGAPLRAAQRCLGGHTEAIWVTLVYGGRSSTLSIAAHVFHRRRIVEHER